VVGVVVGGAVTAGAEAAVVTVRGAPWLECRAAAPITETPKTTATMMAAV